MKKEIRNESYLLMHPKPTLLITSISRTGKPNVMACAWATPVSEEPPLLLVCLAKGGYTSELIEQTQEFVINIPTEKLMKAIHVCGTKSGRQVDKVKLARLNYQPAKKVKVPIIKECIGHIECRLNRRIDGGECNIFIGEIVTAYADEKLYREVWSTRARIPLHLGGVHFACFKKIK